MMKSNNMLQGLWVMLAVVLMACQSAAADDKKKDLFPAMEGWKLEVGEQVYNSGNLWNIINGAADAYLSYDFEKLYTAEYIKGDDQRLKVYIFQHSTPTNTFGIYSQERSSDYTFVSTGAQGFSNQDAYYFITGPYYVQISTNDQGLSDAMAQLASNINGKIGASDNLPETLGLFPEKGLVENSEKYIASNFLGFSYLHSAFQAEYKKGDESFRMFIIHPGKKEEIDQMLSEYFDFVEQPQDQREGAIIQVEDPYNGKVWLSPQGQYLGGVIGASRSTGKEYIRLLRDQLE